MKDNARYKAVKLLGKTFSKNGYSNILLDKALEETDMDEREKALCSALYYGVTERRITLDYIISCYSKRGTDKINPEALNILRSGLYQILYMDSIPDNAAVNESVNIAKRMHLGKLSGFINAVLRNFIRDGKKIKFPDKSRKEMLSVKYSVPVWLVQMLLEEYDEKKALSLMESSLGKPPVMIRLNSLKGSNEDILKELSDMELEKTSLDGCFIAKSGDVRKSKGFSKGLFHVQDISSQLCCMALAPKEGDTVLDVCAAPGGKTFTMAELSGDKAYIHAFDIHEHRARLIRQGAERLGIRSVRSEAGDASKLSGDVPMADKILCDVPCSGLGVIRRKPEIKYKDPKEFERLPLIQYEILKRSAEHLKPGGELVYSTCTVSKNENDMVIDKFLEEHSDYEGVPFLEHLGEPFGGYKAVLFPMYFNNDGFFISKIRRKK